MTERTKEAVEPLLVNTGSIDDPTPLSEAIVNGYAPGGELYTYSSYPELTHQDLVGLLDADYPTIFHKVAGKLFGCAVPEAELRKIADDSYSDNIFDFDPEDRSLRFVALSSGVYVAGLSDGPTGAFKDMAMQPFARVMQYLMAQDYRSLSILLATSGDTGPAALDAFGKLENTEIIAMLPESGVSPFQWSQMAEASVNPDVHVLEVNGNFSDLNDMHMVADGAFDLSAVNSVNIARIIAQVPYHVASYLKAIKLEGLEVGDPVDLSIPSGNFGNTLSAIIARKMGLPIANIIVATNENNTLDRLFRTGIFELAEFHQTSSSAQDVRMPSNVWRYFAMLFGNNTEKIAEVYRRQQELGKVALDEVGIEDRSVIEGVLSTTVYQSGRQNVMRGVFNKDGIVLDPHTANGVGAVSQLSAKRPGVPMVTYETAKPFKFDDYVSGVLGVVAQRPDRFQGLENRASGIRLPQINGTDQLLRYIIENTFAKIKDHSN